MTDLGDQKSSRRFTVFHIRGCYLIVLRSISMNIDRPEPYSADKLKAETSCKNKCHWFRPNEDQFSLHLVISLSDSERSGPVMGDHKTGT